MTAWAEQKVVREIMVFLHNHGVGAARAVRIYKTYGVDAVQVMSENPYRLARLTAIATSPDRAHGALLLLTYSIGAALPMLAVAYGGQAISTRLRRVAPYVARLQQAFGVIVIAFALSAIPQYDAIALAWLGHFFPAGRPGL